MTQSTGPARVNDKPAPGYPKNATPGPWEARPHALTPSWMIFVGDVQIADFWIGDDWHTNPATLPAKANAQLAAAAPDLFEALRNAVNRLQTIRETHPDISLDHDLAFYCAALAKARGEVAK